MKKYILGAVGAVMAAAIPLNATEITPDSNAEILADGNDLIFLYRQSGTLSVTEAGTVQVLVVGGGGGGGTTNLAQKIGGGGGGGGVVYSNSFAVAVGENLPVVVGDGGAVDANGGDSSVFGLVAYGGGAGAGYNKKAGKNGASGGGGSGLASSPGAGGQAIHSADGNLGNPGGASSHLYGAGGGGGAGSPGGDTGTGYYDIAGTPGRGGDGISCAITGEALFYGGGGAGYLQGRYAPGGKGGGGSVEGGTVHAAAGNSGGGGCGGHPGGSGIVIIRFTPATAPGEAGRAPMTGGDRLISLKTARGKERVHVFENAGTLTVPDSGFVEILAVGGGGGGGVVPTSAASNNNAGGGGAGGVVHSTIFLAAGSYQISIGAGGEPGVNGGVTTGLGVTAYGGGAGARGGTLNARLIGASPHRFALMGASGGGACTSNTVQVLNYGGPSIFNSVNLGNYGGNSSHSYNPGGGGGAGSPGMDNDGAGPGAGGDGIACSITGESVYYGGGGAGYRGPGSRSASGGQGGGGKLESGVGYPGENGKGGGGCGGQNGGSGVFIVRYMVKPDGFVVLFK